MLPSKLEDVTLDALQQLVDDAVPEGKLIDYKKEFYRLDSANSDDKRKQHEELLKDISSFANCLGGDLIIGMDEDKLIPTGVCGFAVPDVDVVIGRITQLVNKWLEPKISMAIRAIELSPGAVILVIRVQRSLIGPHRVIYDNKPGQFWTRNSHGAESMDTMALRQAFVLSQSVSDKIRAFRKERVESIIAGDTHAVLTDEPKLILHLIPQDAYTSRLDFPVATFPHLSLPLIAGTMGRSPRFNMDGLVWFNRHDGPSSAYAQIYRNGIVESVCNGVVFHHPQDEEKKCPMFMTSDLPHLFGAFPHYLKSQQDLGISPPIWCFVTITGMKGVRVPSNRFNGVTSAIDRDILWLPELQVTDYNVGRADTFLKPLVDMIWNSGGEASCPNYNVHGEYALK